MNLPRTDFPMRANLSKREPDWVARWEADGTHARITAKRREAAAPPFVLHDGPPYANGHIHMGTAYNKILKDIIVKYKSMRGYYSPYVPGWDCHGQPIEHRVETELGPEKMAEMPKAEIRKLCREYAMKWIDVQRDEFRRLGVLGNWDEPYLTLHHSYEAGNVKLFKRMYLDGAIYRGRKAIHWCPRCHTALAEAEIEYSDEISPSIYVAFDMQDVPDAWAAAADNNGQRLPVRLAIWTTTPWTLPANVAVTLAPDAAYVALVRPGELLIVARELAEAVGEVCGWDHDDLQMATDAQGHVIEIKGADLMDLTYAHPIHPERTGRIITGEHVDMSTGTGAVHTAPGHGADDYLMGEKYDLETLMPVDDDGVFDQGGGPFAGLSVWEANPKIIEWLREQGSLIAAGEITHSYPHCWRCKKPVIFRATEQWFVSMDKTGLRERALAGFDTFRWIPEWSRNRLGAMIEDRPDWCISRQRSWGVPIPVHRCAKCGGVVANEATFDAVIALFEEQGADAWFTLQPADYLPADTVCPQCGAGLDQLTPESDIVDVWWESGVSHTSVLRSRDEFAASAADFDDSTPPAQMYLEGSDQHRGWFQSSYITSEGAYGTPPWENLLTHGFTVDGEGRKMSKSVGNVISPIDICDQYGADIIRLWVATTDFSGDVGISDEILQRTAESYRRIRNSFRFLLGNLYDFDPRTDSLPHPGMEPLDKYWMVRLRDMLNAVTEYNDDWKFYLANKTAIDFLGEFSSVCLDVLKDRLYADAPTAKERRSAQTLLAEVLRVTVRLFAPVLSFTCEEVWDFLPDAVRSSWTGVDADAVAAGQHAPSVHEMDWPQLKLWMTEDEEYKQVGFFTGALRNRELANKALEEARAEGKYGRAQEADLLILGDPGTVELLARGRKRTLEEVFQTASVTVRVGTNADEVNIELSPSPEPKCPRCWRHLPLASDDPDFPDVCPRCAQVLHTIGYEPEASA
jgi:isoleucyl-tRNA synthetase